MLLEFLWHASPGLVSFVFICLLIPVYLGRQQRWTRPHFWNYVRYIIKIYFVASLLYIAICLLPTYASIAAPNSKYYKLIARIGECASRFRENDCTTPCIKRSNCAKLERECFALAMCLRQPLFLLWAKAIFGELLAQIFSKNSWDAFIILTGTYVISGLLSGWWINRDRPVANGPALGPQPPPTPPPGTNGPAIVNSATPNSSLGNNAALVRTGPIVNQPVANQAPVVNHDPAPRRDNNAGLEELRFPYVQVPGNARIPHHIVI